MNEQMMEMIQNMTPEQQEAFLANYSGEQGGIDKQMANAAMLRDRQTGKGRTVGNQFIAGSPLSGLANIVNQGTAAYKRSGAQDKQGILDKKKATAMELMGSFLRGTPNANTEPQLDPKSLQDAPILPYDTNPNQQIT